MKPERHRLLLINPVDEYGKRTTFTGSKGMLFPPISLLYIAALTPDDWDITIVDEAVEELKMPEADLVGLTAYTSNANRAYEIATLYRERGTKVVMGGIHASMVPDEALRYVDAVVSGEAESVWAQVVADFEGGSLAGLYVGEHLPLAGMVLPRRDLQSPRYSLASIQTSRGCPFDCDFCSVTRFNGGAYRMRPVNEVLDELETIEQRNLLFADDNILGNTPEHRQRALELFKGMVERGIRKTSIVQASVDIAEDEEVLRYAARSGVRLVIMGFESINPDTLKEMNKRLNQKRLGSYREVVRRLHRHGIGVYASFIVGSDADGPTAIADTVRFGLDASIDLPIFTILTPLPGTRQYEKVRSRIIYSDYPKDWERYTFVEPVHELNMPITEFMDRYVHDWARIFTIGNIAKRGLTTLMLTRSPITTGLVVYLNLGFRKITRVQRQLQAGASLGPADA